MLRQSSPDMTSATTSVLCVRVPRLCKKYTSERLCRSGYAVKYIVPRLFENYTRCEWVCLHSSGYALEYTVPRLCHKYTCSEWAWLYASGYPLKCIAPLTPIGIRNLHSSPRFPWFPLRRVCVWQVDRVTSWPFDDMTVWRDDHVTSWQVATITLRIISTSGYQEWCFKIIHNILVTPKLI